MVRNVDFRTLHVMSRDQILRYLCQYYRLDFLKPTMHNVALSDGSVATVPIFDAKQTLLALITYNFKLKLMSFWYIIKLKIKFNAY